jgi:hypothetical protein
MLLIGISLGRLPWYAIIILYLITFSLSGAYHMECKNLNSERDGGLLVIYGFTFVFVLINLQQEEGWHNYHAWCYWLYQLLVAFILSVFYTSELKSKNLPFEDYISFVISIILIVISWIILVIEECIKFINSLIAITHYFLIIPVILYEKDFW